MSLLRLLTAGRCWIGAKPMGRYKFTDPRSMPKFGPGPNPFKPKAEEKKEEERRERGEGLPEEAVRGEVGGGKTDVEVVTEVVESEAKPDELDRSDGLGAGEVKAVESKAEDSKSKMEKDGEHKTVSLLEKKPRWISRVGSLTNSLRIKIWKPRKSAPQPRPVQGELSLDNIKPVRNDLSETDLEVVPLRTSAIVKAKARNKAEAAEGGLESNDTPAQPKQSPPEEQDLIEASRT